MFCVGTSLSSCDISQSLFNHEADATCNVNLSEFDHRMNITNVVWHSYFFVKNILKP